MKKEGLSLFLAGMMTMTALAGCGSSGDKEALKDEAGTAGQSETALAEISGQTEETELPLNILDDKYSNCAITVLHDSSLTGPEK
jgi:hypothetical protein